MNSPTTEKINVLLIEDEESIATPLIKLMKLRGYELTWAKNGEEAFELLEKNPKIDCLFIDIMLPKMTGWQIRDEQKKKDAHISSIPAIFLSADGASAKEAEVRGEVFVAKPIDLNLLETRLNEAVKKDK